MKNQKSNRTTGKGIQSYVDYLLEDIQLAEEKTGSLNQITGEEDLTHHLMEVERLVFEEPINTFGEICGLTKEQFPPPEQLSKRQTREVIKAFHQLLRSWNMGVDFPKKLPPEKVYKFLVSVLDEKTHILKNGFAYFEFCTCHPDSCPFEEYCTCRDKIEKILKEESNNASLAPPKRLREGE